MHHRTHLHYRATLSSLAVLLLATLLSACGGPTAQPPEASRATPTPTALATNDADGPSASDGAWRTDLPIGASVGDVSHATPVLLADGSTVTLEELADGKPLLLYFYATW